MYCFGNVVSNVPIWIQMDTYGMATDRKVQSRIGTSQSK